MIRQMDEMVSGLLLHTGVSGSEAEEADQEERR